MSTLAGKVAIITGGAGGIGKTTTEKFLKEGAKVLISRLNARFQDKAKSELEDINAVKADVTNESEVQQCVKQVIEHFTFSLITRF
ncbi:SDR family NAD(P)-dependent oxidoreductase [Paenibacillus foliorum]|uniref:SDR family NAD(P)-dependent oxidoreductase n=1 Tax=Paenibacillus foliorum TaxID=2654974 RepID=UPI001FEB013F|nr:SDR family NAD(P)-dependent oxidoreductase [Paenibacillus foliorum]